MLGDCESRDESIFIFKKPLNVSECLEFYLEEIYISMDDRLPSDYFQREKDAIRTNIWLLKTFKIISPELQIILNRLIGIVVGILELFDCGLRVTNEC